MRLIDADAFEKSVMFGDAEDMQDVIYALRDYPITYDIDKVIKRLEKLRDCKYLTGITNNAYEFGACDALNDAIKIIKAGGDIELSEHSKSQGNREKELYRTKNRKTLYY